MNDREKITLSVDVELDDVPGTFHTVQSAMDATQAILNNAIPHYNPKVHENMVIRLAFCEKDMLVMRPYRTYIFEPIEGCEKCDALVKEYEEGYGVTDTPRIPVEGKDHLLD